MNRISLKIIILVILAVTFFTGCAKSHRVFINPSLPIHNSTIGNQLPVTVNVIDNRPNNIISKWRGGLNIRKFTVISQGDLKDIFTNRVQQALSKLGFSPKSSHSENDRIFTFEIINIKSRYQEALPKMNVQIGADVKATCYNSDEKLSRVFTSRKTRSDITPASFPNESLLNASLSEIMGKVFSDSALLVCLSH